VPNDPAVTATAPASPPESAPAGKAAAMRFILLVVLIDMMAVGLIVPVLPPLVGRFTASPDEQAHWYSVVTFAFAVASFVGAPLLGALSDRFGRRPVLLLGFCGLAVNFFWTALASSMWMLVASRIVGGGMQANAAVANAYVADISAPEERAKRFGQVGAMFGLGFILGPALGGILGDIDLRLPFVVAGVLALLNLVYGYFVLPESLGADKRRAVDWERANPFGAFKALARLKGVGLLVGVLCAGFLAQFVLYTTWVLYNSFKYGWGPAQNGWSLFAVGIVSALVQGVLLSRLLKRFTPQRLAMMGMASATVAFVLWGAASQGWMVYAVIFANLLGGTVAASLNSLISGAAGDDEQGRTMGAVSGLSSLMAVIGPLLGPPLLATVAHLPRGDWRIGAPMYLCAALQALALLMAWWHFRGADGAAPARAAVEKA
jgi:DHA1 family tetracycline resistance protein-like MFS transporter